ncbi:hypothetical protein HX787_08070 [Pseudomonas tolaasii]|uniref:Uncharacterized protein n=1 Tax=Pseudomonas tolaasii TaxID=29442 RepID=A0A7Y8DQB2_PSETO|nr:hypothetical protein [Pseudomonas tolaasii]NWC20353.1 hypothetical protein [Pseudomonas tolaasii]NWD35810.1 hypothetical protein [Pseudomonas tolaasii]
MKYLIDKAAYDALEPSLQAFYKAQGEEYVLAVEGLPTGGADLEGLKRLNQTLLDEAKEAKRLRREADEKLEREKLDAAKAKGDFEQLYASSEQALAAERARLAELTTSIERRDLTSAASKIATGIADGENAEILAEFVQRRLKIVEGQVKVTDASGNLTIATLDDLAKEFQQAPRYASLVRGSQSSGGGAAGNMRGGATKQLHEMSDAERIKLSNENPALFSQLVAQAKSKE